LSILWLIAVEVVTFLQCQPLQAFWTISMQLLPTTKCIDTILFFVANSISNCIIDFLVIVLPIPEILKLQVSRSKKWGLCGIFLLGGM
jgi:isoprenylcysteine carboxyl methyltransferase (ICMT) family protein YpbQ